MFRFNVQFSDQIALRLVKAGSSRDEKVKKIIGVQRKPIAPRLETDNYLSDERIEQTLPIIEIDAGETSQD